MMEAQKTTVEKAAINTPILNDGKDWANAAFQHLQAAGIYANWDEKSATQRSDAVQEHLAMFANQVMPDPNWVADAAEWFKSNNHMEAVSFMKDLGTVAPPIPASLADGTVDVTDLSTVEDANRKPSWKKTCMASGCKEKATTGLVWAGGRAVVPVCESHKSWAQEAVAKNGQLAEVVGFKEWPPEWAKKNKMLEAAGVDEVLEGLADEEMQALTKAMATEWDQSDPEERDEEFLNAATYMVTKSSERDIELELPDSLLMAMASSVEDVLKQAPNVRDVLESRIHESFTRTADRLLTWGVLTRKERIALSGMIGSTLKTFGDQIPADLSKRAVEAKHLESIVKATTTIQTIIFDKSKFKKGEATKWAVEHNFKDNKVDETGSSFRLRQKEPGLFKTGSFRTISLTDGVKAVIGVMKTTKSITTAAGGKANPATSGESFMDGIPKTAPTHIAKDCSMDPYMVEQTGTITRRFVVQRHFQDVWSPAEQAEIKAALAAVDKTSPAGQVTLDAVWSQYKLHRLTASLKSIQREVRLAGCEPNKILEAVAKFMDTSVPDLSELGDAMPNIVNIGSVHVDLRMETPAGDLVGWSLDTPGLVVQTLNGKLLPIRRDQFNQYEEGDSITALKKTKHNIAWLDVATSDSPVFYPETHTGEASEFRLVDEGVVIYGCQKTEFHEYFLFFKKNKDMSGRWVSRLRYDSADSPADQQFWRMWKPTYNQRPYIMSSSEQYETELANAEGTQLVWNIDTLDALDAIGFKYEDDDQGKVAKAAQIVDDDETVVPIIVEKAAAVEERMVYGVVLEPEAVDAHGEVIDKATIKRAAHLYMEFYQQKGFQHGKSGRYPQFPKGLRIMESYIAPVNMTVNGKRVRAGSWVMAMRVDHDGLWEDIKTGRVTGFSIGGIARVIQETRIAA